MSHPEILRSLSGEPITTAEEFDAYRRGEILQLFRHYVYGEVPAHIPTKADLREIKIIPREGGVTQKKVTLALGAQPIAFDVFLPAERRGALPAFLHIAHPYMEEVCPFDRVLTAPRIPLSDILARGYALVNFKAASVSVDVFRDTPPFQSGIFATLGGERTPSSWGVISAWVFAISRVMDYLATDEDIDETRVAAIGHSRAGKTALWAAACDERIRMAISSCSGCAGAAYTRGKEGEHVKEITERFDWFCDNYKNYAEREEMLPVDQHMLLAAIAPRPIYVASATRDTWADPSHELLSCRMASEAYALYGKKGCSAPPDGAEIGVSYADGYIGYHLTEGEHDITHADWAHYLAFADQRL